MKIAVLLCILSLIVYSSCQLLNPTGCGKRQVAMLNKIVNGQTSRRGEWPWQISLRQNGRHICGGSLINNQWVVTAAHCVAQSPMAYQYEVVLGAQDQQAVEQGRITVKVNYVIPHSQFQQFTFINDIALIKLAQPVQYNQYIQPVCVATTFTDLTNRDTVATGWGSTFGLNGAPSRYLMKVTMKGVSDTECRGYYGHYNRNAHLCSGRIGEGTTCRGDSGGPLVVYDSTSNSWVLHGLTSFGMDCRYAAAFCRVSSYNQWMLDVMRRYP